MPLRRHSQGMCRKESQKFIIYLRFDGKCTTQRNGKFIFRNLIMRRLPTRAAPLRTILSYIKDLLTFVPFPISIVEVIIRFHIRYTAWRKSRSYREISVRSIGRCTTISYGNSGRPFTSGGIAKGRAVHTNRQEEHQHQRQF